MCDFEDPARMQAKQFLIFKILNLTNFVYSLP